jgi:hypothetical protein
VPVGPGNGRYRLDLACLPVLWNHIDLAQAAKDLLKGKRGHRAGGQRERGNWILKEEVRLRAWGESSRYCTLLPTIRSEVCRSSFCFEQQHRNVHGMPNVVRDASIEEVGNEAMSVCGHGDEVNLLLTGNANDLVRRFAVREDIVGLDALYAQRFAEVGKVVAIMAHFVRLSKLELIEIACYPAVSDADQKQLCTCEGDEALNVVQDYLIVGGVFNGNEYLLIHDFFVTPSTRARFESAAIRSSHR